MNRQRRVIDFGVSRPKSGEQVTVLVTPDFHVKPGRSSETVSSSVNLAHSPRMEVVNLLESNS